MKIHFGRVILLALICAFSAATQAEEKKQILGVFYDGCDSICEGFKAEIAESGFNAELKVLDLKENKARLPEAVKMARDMKADLVVVYGTNATLGVIGTLDDRDDPRYLHDIPVVFTVVADPFGARIAESFERSGRPNVAGTFNRVPEATNIEVIRKYDPEFKKLGLLFNSNEKNSVLKMQELSVVAPKLGVELVALEIDPENSGPPDPALIAVRLRQLKEKGVKWLYVGSSAYLRANGEAFTASAIENGIAVVSPYEELVRDRHALLSIASRLEDVGRLAADQALKILRDGAKPGDLPVARATKFAYVVNMKVAGQLDRFPPFSFLQGAEIVGK
jgi:putative ABC transport system substrate-binding protein